MSKPDMYARDLDGSGSLHACAKGDIDAIPMYAIDDDTRDALKEAIANFREDMSDLHPQSSLLPRYRKYVAAIERLIGEGE